MQLVLFKRNFAIFLAWKVCLDLEPYLLSVRIWTRDPVQAVVTVSENYSLELTLPAWIRDENICCFVLIDHVRLARPGAALFVTPRFSRRLNACRPWIWMLISSMVSSPRSAVTLERLWSMPELDKKHSSARTAAPKRQSFEFEARWNILALAPQPWHRRLCDVSTQLAVTQLHWLRSDRGCLKPCDSEGFLRSRPLLFHWIQR